MVSSIGYTIIGDINYGTSKGVATEPIAFGTNEASVYSALSSEPEHDRATYIKNMQAKLANGEGKIAGAPIVLISSVPIEEQESSEDLPTHRSVVWCDMIEQTEDIEKMWNPADVNLYTVEGVRVVAHANIRDTDTNGTSGVILPITYDRAAQDACLPHTIIGIALDGGLIKNSDALKFKMYGEQALVGYALDGHPIYGVPADESLLDTCGGMNTTGEYRYHVRENENFILSCFASPPVKFIRS